jgi:hypothetical protein
MLGEPAPPNGQIRSYGRWMMDLSGASFRQWVIYLRSSSGSKSILLTRAVEQGRVREMPRPGSGLLAFRSEPSRVWWR